MKSERERMKKIYSEKKEKNKEVVKAGENETHHLPSPCVHSLSLCLCLFSHQVSSSVESIPLQLAGLLELRVNGKDAGCLACVCLLVRLSDK